MGRESNQLPVQVQGRWLAQDRNNRGIYAAVGSVARIHLLHYRRLRSHMLGDPYHFAAGGVDRTPYSRSHPCEDRRPVGRTFFGFEDGNLASINVRLNLPPKWRPCPATAQTNRADRNSHFGKEREGISQTESYPFENRSDDMPAGVRNGQADQGGAGIGIKVGSALAHQERSPQESLGPGRHGSSLGCKTFVGVPPILRISASAKAVTKPAQGKTRRLRNSHHVPAAGYGMTESVQPSFSIKRRTICSGKYYARCPNGCAHRARGSDSHAHGAGRLVSGAGHDRRAHWQASAPAGETFPQISGDSHSRGSSDASIPAA
jgi:hypothetical protein